jgi:hypothetical protein
MGPNIDELIKYLNTCVFTWVDHELLTRNFSEVEIWRALHLGYLKTTSHYHRYDIDNNRITDCITKQLTRR